MENSTERKQSRGACFSLESSGCPLQARHMQHLEAENEALKKKLAEQVIMVDL